MGELTPRQKYNAHKSDAARRGIAFLFSFDDWWQWWQIDDRWSQRGRGKGKFVMARFGDVGPYSPANVRCATFEENNAEVSHEVKSAASVKACATKRERGTQHLQVRGARHPRSRPVLTPDGTFESGWLAADHYGICRNAIYHRIRVGMPGFAWAEQSRDRETAGKTGSERR